MLKHLLTFFPKHCGCYLFMFIMLACNTQKNTISAVQKQKNSFTADEINTLKASLFVTLTGKTDVIQRWEQSNAWIAYYQGQLYQALELFAQQSKLSELDAIAVARIHLDLSEIYQNLEDIQRLLLAEWLKSEQGRPRADLHKMWYQWIAYGMQKLLTPDSKTSNHDTANQPEATFTDEMKPWVQLLTHVDDADVPDQASTAYRKWFSFYKHVSKGNWDKADRLWKRLKLSTPMIKVKGQGDIPALAVYDVRVLSSVQKYHAHMAIRTSKDLQGWGQLIHTQALMQAKKHTKAYQVVQTLLKKVPQTTPEEILVLNSVTQEQELHIKAMAYTSVLAHKLGESKACEAWLQKVKDFRYQFDHSHSEDTNQKASKASMSLVQSVWYYWARSFMDQKSKVPQALLSKRRAYIQKTLDLVKTESKTPNGFQSVAGLGMVERWLDQLYFRLAEATFRTDQRVYAFNILKSLEDLTAAMRLQGRNRLNRLILIAFNQLKMNRYRVTSKYFNRIRKEFPAIKSLIEMTSDLLSGKAFLNQEKVNAGQ